uniref:amphiregulin-like n=1 Tax=Myxine glutinosa TaxID=7769 RepID=UPI00358FA998
MTFSRCFILAIVLAVLFSPVNVQSTETAPEDWAVPENLGELPEQDEGSAEEGSGGLEVTPSGGTGLHLISEQFSTSPPKIQSRREKAEKLKKEANVRGVDIGYNRMTRCTKRFQHYCVTGTCRYFRKLKKAICRCDNNFTGERCNRKLMMKSLNNEANHQNSATLPLTAIALAALSLLLSAIMLLTTRCRTEHNCNVVADLKKSKLQKTLL